MSINAVLFQEMLAGPTSYDLYASGISAAIVTHNGMPRLVQGTSNLDFHLGYGMHWWGGSFYMSNGNGDNLSFSISNGDVSPLGDLVNGTFDSYFLKVDGANFSTPSGILHGRLVGQSGASPIPTGAIGTFDFQHGGAATVQGVFGADL
jgi:hypothetical protein